MFKVKGVLVHRVQEIHVKKKIVCKTRSVKNVTLHCLRPNGRYMPLAESTAVFRKTAFTSWSGFATLLVDGCVSRFDRYSYQLSLVLHLRKRINGFAPLPVRCASEAIRQ